MCALMGVFYPQTQTPNTDYISQAINIVFFSCPILWLRSIFADYHFASFDWRCENVKLCNRSETKNQIERIFFILHFERCQTKMKWIWELPPRVFVYLLLGGGGWTRRKKRCVWQAFNLITFFLFAYWCSFVVAVVVRVLAFDAAHNRNLFVRGYFYMYIERESPK